MIKKIKGHGHYWAVLCYSWPKDPMVCGVFASKREAEELAKEIKGCPSRHSIKKCTVEIKL